MSNQPEDEMQQTLTSEEVRQPLLAEIEASKQAVVELSNERLEEVVGGLSLRGGIVGLKQGWSNASSMAKGAGLSNTEKIGASIRSGFSGLTYGVKNGAGSDTVKYAIEQAKKHVYGT
jgi:hypothetical protein